MQHTEAQPGRPRGKGGGSLKRAVKYIKLYPRLTLAAAAAMLIATGAQLAVPQLIQRIIDLIISNTVNKTILGLPAAVQTIAAERLGLDLTVMQSDLAGANRALIIAGIIIVLFAIIRGLFAFNQA
ncbi:MAG TPA: hypothetical protein EYH05_12800, partial [Anaerolineae bacterium]|nr:hypothetical protein [Anaerolineae bacterium]